MEAFPRLVEQWRRRLRAANFRLLLTLSLIQINRFKAATTSLCLQVYTMRYGLTRAGKGWKIAAAEML